MKQPESTATTRRKYNFHGTSFHIREEELPRAVHEARRLHDRLLDQLVAHATQHARLLSDRGAAGDGHKL